MRRFETDTSGGLYEWPEGGLVMYEDHALALRAQDKRITELEAEVLEWQKCCREGQEMLNTIGRQLGGKIPEQLVSEVAQQCMDRIAELEKQAAIDKTLLALADARINRELRDDFAGRAMQGILAQPGMTVDIDGDYIGQRRAELAYGLADALLKAKGGA